jgi:hypothetical protein
MESLKWMKLIQEKAGHTLGNVDIGNSLMNATPVSWQLRESINK